MYQQRIAQLELSLTVARDESDRLRAEVERLVELRVKETAEWAAEPAKVKRLRQAVGDQVRWLASVQATGRYNGADSARRALEYALEETA